jgi:hypothetical protein
MKRILLFTISFSVLVFGFSAPAQAAPKSIKLTKAQFKNVGPYQCGLVKGAWVPGINTKSTKKVRYFIPFTAYAADETKKAKKVKGKSKSAVKKRAAFEKKAANFTTRANQQASTCASGVYVSAMPTCPNCGPIMQAPLRINISGATGLAKAEGSISSFLGSGARSVLTGDSSQARYATTGSTLAAVTETGALRDAITSGSIQINNFVVAANGKTYITGSGPGMYIDGNLMNGQCVLIEVSAASDVPTCIQSNPNNAGSNWFSMMWYGNHTSNTNPAIQVDAAGSIYYSGNSGQSAILRKWTNGVTRDIVSDNTQINDFVVLPNGDVVVSGYTQSLGTSWIRLYLASGGVRNVESSNGTFMRKFADGNLYYGFQNGEIKTFNTQSLTKVSNSWFGGTSPVHIAATVCPTLGCSNLYSPRRMVQLSDNSIYALFQSNGSNLNNVAKVHPSVAEVLPGSVVDAKIIGSAGTKVAIAGLDVNGAQTLEIFNPASNSFVTLLNASNEIEIGAMSYRASGNQLVFSGLRFADNKTVVGTVDLNTNSITFGLATSSKLYDLQAFG